ncbi:hypothetical protein CPB86DRAFT_853872 [Serendipita vermifera]|nr:hypothetical protein CPB86DRAFT_853872 [Serendipita vermifera]
MSKKESAPLCADLDDDTRVSQDNSHTQYPPTRGNQVIQHTRSLSNASVRSEPGGDQKDVPRVFGLPLKYVSLVTLALQNALLAIIMHYSRVSVAADKVYSASSAVLMNEILKGSISFFIAFLRTKPPQTPNGGYHFLPAIPNPANASFPPTGSATYLPRLQSLISQIASPDCWKLSIPALLYVLQNNLQFIAVSNLDVPTFQVTNQMKILTTAGFSVLLLKKRLNGWKWASLALLTIGVAIVQIQATSGSSGSHVSEPMALPKDGVLGEGGDTMDPAPNMPVLHPLKGFLAVFSACFTSGLAGVYFEMVLKGSKADLWVRNVQLSLWSLVPAMIPVVIGLVRDGMGIQDMFANFGFWAWLTVITQVFGGLVTALVIKYSDNILKGFATSLSIIVSFFASVALFNLAITPSFLVGAAVVLGATWMYNTPEEPKSIHENSHLRNMRLNGEDVALLSSVDEEIRKTLEQDRIGNDEFINAALISPIGANEPILGYPDDISALKGHLKKVSIGERVREKVSGFVGAGIDEKNVEVELGGFSRASSSSSTHSHR